VHKFLIVIVGPTAIGKSSLAIELAKFFSTEIISADSRQFYRELNIGTAKPTPAELNEVKHHFINSLSIHDDYDVSRFEDDAIKCLEDLYKKNDVAILVGGSGLFVQAVCNGFDPLPESDQSIRSGLKKMLDEKGIESLQAKLEMLDPEYYATVDAHNPHRLIRALEVCLTTGMKYSELRKKINKPRSFIPVKIGLDDEREKVYQRINARVEEMIHNGLADEARKLYPLRHLNALQTVGYRELFDWMENKITFDDAVELIRQNTRRYAKRQLTWFRKDREITWFKPGEAAEIISFIRERMQPGHVL